MLKRPRRGSIRFAGATSILVLGALLLPIGYAAQAGSLTADEIQLELQKIRPTNNWSLIRAQARKCLELNPRSNYCRECLVEASVQLGDLKVASDELQILCKEGKVPKIKQYFLWALIKDLQHQYKDAKKFSDLMLAAGTPNSCASRLAETITFKVNPEEGLALAIKNRHASSLEWYTSGGLKGDHASAFKTLKKLLADRNPNTCLALPCEFESVLFAHADRSQLSSEEITIAIGAFVTLKRYDEALSWVRPVASSIPEESLQLLKLIANDDACPKPLLDVMDKNQSRFADNDIYWFIRGAAYRALHEYPKAIACAEHAIELKPREENYWLLYGIYCGQAYDEQKNADARVYMRALDPLAERYPSLKVFGERARVFGASSLIDQQLQEYSKMLKLLPSGAERNKILIQKLAVQYRIGDLRAAQSTCQALLNSDPKNAHGLRMQDKIRFEMERAAIK